MTAPTPTPVQGVHEFSQDKMGLWCARALQRMSTRLKFENLGYSGCIECVGSGHPWLDGYAQLCRTYLYRRIGGGGMAERKSAHCEVALRR